MSFDELVQRLGQSIGSAPGPLKQATEWLLQAEKTVPDFPLMLLSVVGQPNLPNEIKQVASILFKNFVQKKWSELGEIPEKTRVQVRENIVNVILSSPTVRVRKQLNEALISISVDDFPLNWPNLLPSLVSQLNCGDLQKIHSILKAINAILIKYQNQYKSEEVLEELTHILPVIQEPLLRMVQTLNVQLDQQAASPSNQVGMFKCAEVCMKIFYSLNIVDLPEYFETHLAEWVAIFHKYLQVKTNAVELLGEVEDRPGVLIKLQSGVCDNVALYTEQYEEEFSEHIPNFVQDIWTLLMQTREEDKYDQLLAKAMHFLTSISTGVFHTIFEQEGALQNVCEKIIIPNSIFRDSDENNFEFDEEEYIRRDIEGSDYDTRRRCACNLLRGLRKYYNSQVTAIFGQYINTLLSQYASNPQTCWKQKDVALYMFVALTLDSSTASEATAILGDTVTVNELVPLMPFYQSHVLPELQNYPRNHPVIQADCLKFVSLFNSHLQPREEYLRAFNLLPQQLTNESVVVRTYAAWTIDRLLAIPNGITSKELAPMLESLLTNLCNLASNSENDYVMRAIMRTIVASEEEIAPYTMILIKGLHSILERVSKNPKKPKFNHYLFESLAGVIKVFSKHAPQQLPQLEREMFPTFEFILNNNVAEFAPYVFQLVAMLIEKSPSDLSQQQLEMMRVYYQPVHWEAEKAGNIPALVRVLKAYAKRAPAYVGQPQNLQPVLGVFQKLLSSTKHDKYGFELLEGILESLNKNALEPHIKMVFMLIFQRLQTKKTLQLQACFVAFMSHFVLQYSIDTLVQLMNSIQQGIFDMVLGSIWPAGANHVYNKEGSKLVTYVTIKLITEFPPIAGNPVSEGWRKLVKTLIDLLAVEAKRKQRVMQEKRREADDLESSELSYTTTFCPLVHSLDPPVDPLPNIQDMQAFFKSTFGAYSQSKGGEINQALSMMEKADQESFRKFFN